jgi:hypothetical protein
MTTPNTDTPNATTDSQPKPGDKPADKPGDKPTDKPEGGKPSGGTASETFTKDDVDAAVDRALKARDAADKKKEKDAQLSEEERLKQRAESAETALRTREARDVVERAAKDAGAATPAKIYRLYRDEIEFDDKGKPSNLKDLIATAKREYPEEFGKRSSGSADGGEGRGGSSTGRSMNDLIRGGRR